MPRCIVIVGAGISGLSLAFRLQEKVPNADIVVIEKGKRAGGTIWTEEQDGFRFEWGPNGFLDNKPSTMTLCNDLGMADRLVAASTESGKNRYIFLNGRLQRLPTGFGSFLTSRLLTVGGKLSLLMEPFRKKRDNEGDESIDAFVRRRAGSEAANVFADALVTGIHAGDPKLLSVAACFPRLTTLEQEHGSVIKGMGKAAKQRREEAKARGEPDKRPGTLWSFHNGMREIIDALCGSLRRPPRFGVAVKRLRRADGRRGWVVVTEEDESINADVAVLACPAYAQAGLVSDFDNDLAKHLEGIAYNRVAVITLGFHRKDLPRPLDGFGYIAPQRLRRDILGVQWCSSIFADRAPAGMVLMRAMAGGWHRPDVLAWDDQRLLAATRREIELALGIRTEPVWHRIIRWDRAIPQYHLGHLKRIEGIEHRVAEHPGLFVTGNAYHGVALNDCTEQAVVVADKIKAYLDPS